MTIEAQVFSRLRQEFFTVACMGRMTGSTCLLTIDGRMNIFRRAYLLRDLGVALKTEFLADSRQKHLVRRAVGIMA